MTMPMKSRSENIYGAQAQGFCFLFLFSDKNETVSRYLLASLWSLHIFVDPAYYSVRLYLYKTWQSIDDQNHSRLPS